KILWSGTVTKLHPKRCADLFTAADARNRACAREFIAGFGVKPKRFCRSVKLFAGFRSLAQFFGLRARSLLRFFLLQRSNNFISNLFQAALMTRKHLLQGQHIISA